MKTRGECFIPEDFELTAKTVDWVMRKYPQVDIEATLDKFRRDAEAKGWMYRNWQRAFEGIVEKAMANGWRSIVTLNGGREFDPQWRMLLREARKFGFREPLEHEPPGIYRTQFDMWRREPKPSVLPFSSVLKRVVR